ncbi:signal peptidase II [Corynebacterium sp. CNCTC7651]|uniref:signal peptidase II n=1 Tax=Corynebacterium sp. CNCTC7651 TaxID=2815361 RepID=UPI001F22A0B9|nr:signal peptidase II [Corynebacterium sp. CNCTC7651]UIZ91562.1 signal peptidase II [Corynebacterium sp. CNCTC7651]
MNQTKPVSARSYLAPVAALMVVIAVVDQAVKQLMLHYLEPGVPVPVIGDWFRFYLLFNPGASFSMGQNMTWLFTTIQLIFPIAALYFSRSLPNRWEALGLGLIAGGAVGNLCDRLFREPGFWFGHVVDYISVGNFAVFNIADACITVGVVVFVAAMFFGPDEPGTGEPSTAEPAR